MPKYPDAHQPTAEEVRDVVADRQHKYILVNQDELYPVSKWDIVEGILGRDPSHGQRYGSFEGRSRESFINPHLSMSSLIKLLDAMTEQGVLVKVSEPNWRVKGSEESKRLVRAVRFYRVKAGWVLKETLDEQYARVDAKQRDRQREKLRKEAERLIIARHADEVTAAYVERCEAHGLDPDIEIPEPSTNADEEF